MKECKKMRVCKVCGANKFEAAPQKYEFGCVVNGKGEWRQYLPDPYEAITRGSNITGPYRCMECGNTGDKIEDITMEVDADDEIVASLYVKKDDEAMAPDEFIQILNDLDTEGVFPADFFVVGKNYSAIGYYSKTFRDSVMDYYDVLEDFVTSIIRDESLRGTDRIYYLNNYAVRINWVE